MLFESYRILSNEFKKSGQESGDRWVPVVKVERTEKAGPVCVTRKTAGAKKNLIVTLFLPKQLVEEARRLGVKIATIARQALETFVEHPELPPLKLRVKERERVDISVPRELGEELKKRGGPSTAAWFVSMRL